MRSKRVFFLVMVLCLICRVNAQNSSHSDLRTFDLKGPVKVCLYTQRVLPFPTSFGLYAFSSLGEYQPEGITSKTLINRDDEGRITIIKHIFSDDGKVYSIEYNSNGLVSQVYEMVVVEGLIIEENISEYTYNINNRIVSCYKRIIDNINENALEENYTFTYTKYDEKGNWTERIVKVDGESKTEKRTIVYF